MRSGYALIGLVVALTIGAMAPAAAEFFGCNDRPGRVLSSYTDTHGYRANASTNYTHEFAAQSARPRITIHPRYNYPRSGARRYCRSWLAKEYRVSGTVVVPHRQCWWQ